MRVGVAGLGRMGTAIAERLKEVGHDLVVWNRSPEKTKPLADAGAEVAKSPAELATRAEAIVTILTDAAAIDTVYRGRSGILAGGIAGKLVIDMSTVQPETEVRLAAEARAKGAAFVECPVGGTVGPARAGKLIGLAGGEAYALTKHLGKDTAWMMDLFADTSGGPNILKVRGPNIATALAGQDPGPPAFDVDSIRKDLRTMLAEAGAKGFDLPLVARTLSIFDEAAEKGWGKRDGSSLPAYWTSRQA